MKLSRLMMKYEMSEDHLDVIAAAMMEDLDLTATSERLSGFLTPEQVFAVASAFSESEFGEPIDDVAPSMVMERMQMNEARKEEVQAQVKRNKELRRLKAIEEDLMLFEAEQKGRIAV